MKRLVLAAALLAGCGGGAPTGPAPLPAPPTPPARPPTPAPPPDFDQQFWAELAFDAFDCPSGEKGNFDSCAERPALEHRVLRTLPDPSPNFHIRTEGFTVAEVAEIESMLPELAEELTGERYDGEITTGPDGMVREGWILIEPLGHTDSCGSAAIGAIAGLVQINPHCGLTRTTAHEIGHAFGFFHVDDTSAIMHSSAPLETFSDRERSHTQFAYRLGRGTPYGDGPQAAGSEPGAEPRMVRCPAPALH